jgi:hypothetical protein
MWKNIGWIFLASLYSELHRPSCQVPHKLMPREMCTQFKTQSQKNKFVQKIRSLPEIILDFPVILCVPCVERSHKPRQEREAGISWN